MTDHEYLVLAAKAAGYNDINFDEPINGYYPFGYDDDGDVIAWWNPIKDDGDAFRLLSRACISLVTALGELAITEGWPEKGEEAREAFFRRAVVLAAARKA